MTRSANESSPLASVLLERERVTLPWYAVQTQPRREHVAEAHLRSLCCGLFCPRYRRRVLLHGYVREVVRLLFPGYLFAAFDVCKDLRAVHYAHGVRGVVAFGGEPGVVPSDLLASIEAHMENGYVVLRPPQLERGQRVQILAGSFQGYTGIFQAGLKGEERVTVLLDALKYQARLVLDRAVVSPL